MLGSAGPQPTPWWRPQARDAAQSAHDRRAAAALFPPHPAGGGRAQGILRALARRGARVPRLLPDLLERLRAQRMRRLRSPGSSPGRGCSCTPPPRSSCARPGRSRRSTPGWPWPGLPGTGFWAATREAAASAHSRRLLGSAPRPFLEASPFTHASTCFTRRARVFSSAPVVSRLASSRSPCASSLVSRMAAISSSSTCISRSSIRGALRSCSSSRRKPGSSSWPWVVILAKAGIQLKRSLGPGLRRGTVRFTPRRSPNAPPCGFGRGLRGSPPLPRCAASC